MNALSSKQLVVKAWEAFATRDPGRVRAVFAGSIGAGKSRSGSGPNRSQSVNETYPVMPRPVSFDGFAAARGRRSV